MDQKCPICKRPMSIDTAKWVNSFELYVCSEQCKRSLLDTAYGRTHHI